MPAIVPVVLCGGSGTRLWPRSRASKPKPFIPLLGEKTLFQATLERCGDRTVFKAPVVVIGRQHLEYAEPQAAALAPDARFLVEPVGRNTAPAIALAAHLLDPSDIMLVCPSDHHIIDKDAFVDAARNAAALAQADWLVAFGIAATHPETGYGYIRRGDALQSGYRVHSFVEKPDVSTALKFLSAGDYRWNGGIFAFRAGYFLEELARHRPEMAESVAASFAEGAQDGCQYHPEADAFEAIVGESVDYAVMENTDRAALVEADMGWSDIGNWAALMDQRETDGSGNAIVGPGQIIGASQVMIDSDGPHVTVIGANDLVVVVDKDDILVTARESVQRVGEAIRSKNP